MARLEKKKQRNRCLVQTVFVSYNLTLFLIHLYTVVTINITKLGHCYSVEGMGFPLFSDIPEMECDRLDGNSKARGKQWLGVEQSHGYLKENSWD